MKDVTKKLLTVGALLLTVMSARADVVNVTLNGTITSGGAISGVSFAGKPISVGFSYDTATPGIGGVFTGGANFLHPFIDINGSRYVTFADQLAPSTPRTITLSDGPSNGFAVLHNVNGYVGITDMTEVLTLNFVGAGNFLNSTTALPTSLNVAGAGTGAFSLLYADDCQNYACGPVLPFFAGAQFTFDRLTVGSATAVPVPAALWSLGIGLLGLSACTRRRANAVTH
jgi:hypothetical protein